MPEIINLLRRNKNIEILEKIFEYFENVSDCEDEDLINIFSITVLEILGNDRDILTIAQKYMGAKMEQLQMKIDGELGRNVEYLSN